jgi:hypothetical protein
MNIDTLIADAKNQVCDQTMAQTALGLLDLTNLDEESNEASIRDFMPSSNFPLWSCWRNLYLSTTHRHRQATT